jgi:hypothetical protein
LKKFYKKGQYRHLRFSSYIFKDLCNKTFFL